MKRDCKKMYMALLLICNAFTACNVDIPTYNVQVSGTVVDSKGQPVSGADIKVVDRQKDANAMFGNASNKYIDRIVGTTTTDETGHYAISITTEGFHFDVSAICQTQDWNIGIAKSGWARCECAVGQSEYVQDIVAKTKVEYYTGTEWLNAVDAYPLEVGLSDSIHIRLKDDGTIFSAGIWFDSPYEIQKEGVYEMCHSFKSDYGLYYRVDGGDFSMPAGLTEYTLIFTMDTTSASSCDIPYCERCYLKVENLQNSIDVASYFIPLTILNK